MSRTYLMHSFQIVVLNIFFLGRRKNCEKVSPYFSLSGVEKFPNLHFFGRNFSKYHFYGENLQILGGKRIKIGIFGV